MTDTMIEYPSQEGMSEVQKEIDRRVLANVLNGIELLRREYGEDWAAKIDLETLDLSDARNCVLGQLYSGNPKNMSGYEFGLQDLEIYGKDGPYGFSWNGSTPLMYELNERGEDAWPMLNAAWKQEILHLQESPSRG